MCQLCHKILVKLQHKGLVSIGNIKMCEDEIISELKQYEQAAGDLTTEQLEAMNTSLKSAKNSIN